MSWTEQQWTAYMRRNEERRSVAMEDEEAGIRKKISHSIRNVRFCTRTGYLKVPHDSEKVRHTKYFLLAYGAIPYRKICRDYVNPVDPRSILCVCDTCHCGVGLPLENKKTIVACAEPVPELPLQQTCFNWPATPPLPHVYWPKRQNADDGFEIRWTMPSDRIYAGVARYEVRYYREIPCKKWPNSPWKVYKITEDRYVRSIKFHHGGYHHFAVRAVDVHGRYGPFSRPVSLFLTVFDQSTCTCSAPPIKTRTI